MPWAHAAQAPTRARIAHGRAWVSPAQLAAQLGHADGGALAMRVYVHPTLHEAPEFVDGLLSGEGVERGNAGGNSGPQSDGISTEGENAKALETWHFRKAPESPGGKLVMKGSPVRVRASALTKPPVTARFSPCRRPASLLGSRPMEAIWKPTAKRPYRESRVEALDDLLSERGLAPKAWGRLPCSAGRCGPRLCTRRSFASAACPGALRNVDGERP